MESRPRIALVGDHSDKVPAHGQLAALIPHVGAELTWVASTDVGPGISSFDGIWVVPGSPYADQAGVLTAIETARTRHIPYLGTCGGFQHALIEYTRNVLGITDAEDVQYDADASTPLIVPLSCSLVGETAPLHLTPDSRLASVYPGLASCVETYHCRYGLNPEFVDAVLASDLHISGWDEQKAPRAIELSDHPFFIGTLFQPELSSSPADVHPLIEAFLAAARTRSASRHAL